MIQHQTHRVPYGHHKTKFGTFDTMHSEIQCGKMYIQTDRRCSCNCRRTTHNPCHYIYYARTSYDVSPQCSDTDRRSLLLYPPSLHAAGEHPSDHDRIYNCSAAQGTHKFGTLHSGKESFFSDSGLIFCIIIHSTAQETISNVGKQ